MNTRGAAVGTRWTPWAWRLVAIGIALVCSLGPYSTALLRALVPAQSAVVGALMPDFHLHRFGLAQQGPHLKLSATLVNRRYIVMEGRALAPGMGFDVETPARTALLYPCLVLIGMALAWPSAAQRRVQLAAGAGALLAAAVMAWVAQPLVLAGQVWALGLNASDEPTLAAALVAASGFLLHGGGYALCAALVWSITRAGLGRSRS